MKFLALMLALITVCASISLSAALDDTDKTIIKLAMITALDSTDRFTYTNADFSWGNSLDVWYIPEQYDEKNVIKDIGYIIGAYVGVCIKYPEISNLNIYIGTKGREAGKLYCERSWVNDIQVDSQGNIDTLSAGLLVMKAMATFKKIT